ncbi:MAG: helix-turn-helix domain-containing protein [Hyphomicrobiaceae bacterium]|nr:helix-turn-helix domain-containing protein [Hyphomicrobiaceae bacterium]
MVDDLTDASGEGERGGLRERRRKQTQQRIAETGLKLFIENGYEATTLDAIAEAAGISRRTIFHYFKSKDEILLVWQNGIPEMIRAAVLQESTDHAPVDAVLHALLKLSSRYKPEQTIVIDRLMRSTEQLQTAKHSKYLQEEQALFEALCELWPQPERRQRLRVVAMACVGSLRLAIDSWTQSGCEQPIEKHLRDAFADLRAEI